MSSAKVLPSYPVTITLKCCSGGADAGEEEDDNNGTTEEGAGEDADEPGDVDTNDEEDSESK
jgi:hypothetical protein